MDPTLPSWSIKVFQFEFSSSLISHVQQTLRRALHRITTADCFGHGPLDKHTVEEGCNRKTGLVTHIVRSHTTAQVGPHRLNELAKKKHFLIFYLFYLK